MYISVIDKMFDLVEILIIFSTDFKLFKLKYNINTDKKIYYDQDFKNIWNFPNNFVGKFSHFG